MAKGKQAKGLAPELQGVISKVKPNKIAVPEYVYKREGRPTKMTPEVIKKLEEAFALDCTDGEACFYADISTQTLYTYQNNVPEFLERKRELKERPFLKARQTIIKNLDQPEHAKWYMERKKKSEFAQKLEQDHNNPDGNLKTIIINKNYGEPNQSIT